MLVALALCFAATLAYAAPMKITGTIVDNLCADSNKANIGEFVKTHTKSCATMPGCERSGYSIYADKKLTKFTAASNAKIIQFLKNKNSTLNVKIEANKNGDMLDLLSINNAK